MSLTTQLSHPNVSISESALLGSRAWHQTLDRILTMFLAYVPHRFSQICCPTKSVYPGLIMLWLILVPGVFVQITMPLSSQEPFLIQNSSQPHHPHRPYLESYFLFTHDHLISCLFLSDSFPCVSSSTMLFCLVTEVSMVSELSTSWTFVLCTVYLCNFEGLDLSFNSCCSVFRMRVWTQTTL